jgi:pimeloyl-ACP methyl ester carboxylesterase
MTRLHRRYVDTATGQLHVREAGSGAPVLCLHPSPLHAGFLAPQIGALADAGFHAIGLDTPGYGSSDPLPCASGLDDYADALLALADTEGFATFAVYGNATGAQIALALARRAPDRVRRLVLDNCGHFDPDLRAQWEPHYFPDAATGRVASAAHLGDVRPSDDALPLAP